MKKTGYLSLIFLIIISLSFGYLYLVQHAWGTWGDDSAGYIYLWGRLAQGQPLVWQESLTVQALDFFADEKLARWTAPTHHQIISPTGYLASKYPIGLSLLMYWASSLFNSDLAIYFVQPILAVGCLLLTYLLAHQIFSSLQIKFPWAALLSLLAAVVLGLSELYYSYAVAQPMRDIPAIFFLLAGYLFLFLYLNLKQQSRRIFLFILAVLFLGFSFNIRETSLIIALPASLLLLTAKRSKKEWGKLILISVITFAVAIIPSIYNSALITKYKQKFKPKDLTSIALTSNLDHLSSFSLQNIFNNQGKFRPGRGGLPYYWQIIQESTPALFFIALAFLGLLYLFKKNKWLAGSLLLWVISYLALFSLWINPYSRYILPIFPILAILGVYGLYCLIYYLLPQFFSSKKQIISLSAIIVLAFLISYWPTLITIKDNIANQVNIYKAISQEDLNTLKDLGGQIAGPTDLLLFTGDWEYGLSETLAAHTGVQAVRFPLEQKKITFNSEQVHQFLDQVLAQRPIYLWLDSTTNEQSNQFFQANYNLEPLYNYSFTFEPAVQIYAITPKN